MQVHSSRNYIPIVKSSPKHTSPPSTAAIFFATHLMAMVQPSRYSMAEILLFNLVFHDRVTPVSISTLKPPLGVIGILPMKPQASPKLSVCI